MAAARQVGMEVSAENSNDAWPKWKIGLAVGAPIAVVLGGLWYVRRRRRNQTKKNKDETKVEQKPRNRKQRIHQAVMFQKTLKRNCHLVSKHRQRRTRAINILKVENMTRPLVAIQMQFRFVQRETRNHCPHFTITELQPMKN